MEHQTPSVFPGNFRQRKVLGTLCFPFCFPENLVQAKIFTKRNKFNLLLHETFGGGFSPPAVAKINRLARTGFFEGRASAWQFGDPAGRRTFDAQGRDITAKKVR